MTPAAVWFVIDRFSTPAYNPPPFSTFLDVGVIFPSGIAVEIGVAPPRAVVTSYEISLS